MPRKKSSKHVLFWLIAALAILAAYIFYIDLPSRQLLKSEHELDPILREVCAKYGVDSLLVKAVIYQESRFNANARGDAGDIGLMQVVPRFAGADYANFFKKTRPSDRAFFEPAYNIEVGTWYLARQLSAARAAKAPYPEVVALCAYNAGPSKAKSWFQTYPKDPWPAIEFSSTRQYARNIIAQYMHYQKRDGRANINNCGVNP